MSTSSSASALVQCPCGRRDRKGSALPYAQCCGRYVDDFERMPAPDAESLMRSRYTAFVRERADYLKGLDPRYAPFAEQLARLAEQCQSKAIANLVESYSGDEPAG